MRHLFSIIILLLTSFSLSAQTTEFFDSFIEYMEKNSDASVFKESYKFNKVYEIVETKGAEIHQFFIYTFDDAPYFGVAQKRNSKEMMVFDIESKNIITFCLVNNEPYAICGPFSYFSQFAPTKEEYDFKKQETTDHKKHFRADSDSITLDIYLSKEKDFNNLPFNAAFWMIIEETTTYDLPILEKGGLTELKKTTTEEKLIHHALAHHPSKIDKTLSFEGRKIMDFGVFTEKIKYEEKND
ncbi:hypothetical protein KMW28_05780 [Flammeovirga yaeyamensis]|uniref:DUF4412 domain-containing protein n=1 Tax=Flammeovirga yaeyamensis TaxID=367791 RepID=A0AAX1N6A2_9BACT|nr:hypothetical protein [Flammeovirga yaeyamensis]MBB3697676.1 hypothetical protein [Flammeovirga yaeyamensis]NMF35964.1 hypothetical protein [Flammeovirga yaeyamensis]QWG03089.1 hypothetical protein KMW28_05780 [Flammeovirga yaeyamensis]